MAYLLVACQALLLTVFAASAAAKVSSRAAWWGFVASVRALGSVSDRLARAVAATVVAAELGVALMLVPPWTTPAALGLAGLLLTIFTGSVLVSLRRGVRTPCRCFGPSELPLGRRHLVRNVLLLAVVGLGGWGWVSMPAGSHAAGFAVAALAGLLGATVLILFDEIVELFTDPANARSHQEGSA